MHAGRRLFVWYHVAETDAAALLSAARALHGRLQEAHPGLRCELLQRPQMAGGQRTVMESYALEPAGIDPVLHAEIEQQALAAIGGLIHGPRHAEIFDPCA